MMDVDISNKNRLIKKAKNILHTDVNPDLQVKPWEMTNIKRATNWFGNNERVQHVIAKYYRIKK